MNDAAWSESFEPLRGHVVDATAALQDEDGVEQLLAKIDERAGSALEQLGEVEDAETALEALAAVEALASLASYVVNEFYGSQPRGLGAAAGRFAGWRKGVASRLRRLAHRFQPVLSRAATALRAASYSISISFPIGISVGLSW